METRTAQLEVCSAVTASGASREARTRGSCKRLCSFIMTFGGESDQVERRKEERSEGLEMLELWRWLRVWAVAGPCEEWSMELIPLKFTNQF